MSSLNWSGLRPWGGSQHNAFEELCCQLAAYEPAPAGAEYRRVGAPDAGVECIWNDPTGRIRAWQAKFFLKPPSTGEWRQIDDSVDQALIHYPDLAQYTVCLPIDRPDARVPGTKSMMDRWDEHVAKWTSRAATLGRSVTFHYWGEHEIAERLARTEHAGRMYFWFSADLFGPDWFRERFSTARANAGPRYSPELDVKLDISDVFDALTRRPRFVRHVRRQWGIARREIDRACPATPPASNAPEVVGPATAQAADGTSAIPLTAEFQHVSRAVEDVHEITERFADLLPRLEVRASEPLPLDALRVAVGELRTALSHLDAAFEKVETAANAAHAATCAPDDCGNNPAKKQPAPGKPVDRRSSYQNERHHAWRAFMELQTLSTLLTDDSAQVANAPALLITGDAGTGKTHLFCDAAERGIRAGEPCVLLLGEHFVRGDPWHQIVQQLGVACSTPDEFLGALSAAGEAAGRRALILIDALNEGEGRLLWRDHLAGVLATISRYPWIAVAISVRSSYEPVVVPDAARTHLTTVEHQGFAEREVEATRRFFDAYGIERPSVPLLTPEFSNPLFLKLFCSGIRNRGLQRVPPGLEGITAVFSFFLESVQQRLALPTHLDFDAHVPLIERAASALAAEMVASGSQWVVRERAAALTDAILPGRASFEHSLLRGLIVEGVLSEELIGAYSEAPRDAVRFTYERLADHLIARLLLDEALIQDGQLKSSRTSPAVSYVRAALPTGGPRAGAEQSDVEGAVAPCTDNEDRGAATAQDAAEPRTSQTSWPPRLSLETLFADDSTAWYFRGIVGALSIQVPERTGCEIWELWPAARDSSVVTDTFLESLQWRRPDAIGQIVLRVIDHNVRKRTSVGERVRDTLLSLAARPGHPLNAQYLHQILSPGPMAERDVWWSTYAAGQEGEASPLGKLIDWAWHTASDARYADDAVALAAVALAWTLTTPNRTVRDRATKGLVALLHGRPSLLRGLLEQFQNVDDPYVAERLYAVAYGCALRGLPPKDLEALARDIFGRVFANDVPPAHLLLRDYARGVIEVAAARDLIPDLDLLLARPPYQSAPPGPAPGEDELRARYYTPFAAGKDDGYFSLWFSLLSEGDFARYIVGTNSHTFDWSSRPLREAHVPTRRQRYDAFCDALPDARRRAWYGIAHEAARLLALKGTTLDLPNDEPLPITEELIDAWRAHHEARFRRSLPRAMRAEFDDVKGWANEPFEPYPFDLQYALCWLFQRVLSLGWTPERFNWFDRHRDSESRMSHQSERIGKKYQWIAFHEFTARVADHFEFIGDRWSHEPQQYQGPWQLYRRDIDPSYLGRGGPGFRADSLNTWWQPVRYGDWRRVTDDAAWVSAAHDLPALENLATVPDATPGERWFRLRGDVEWREPEPPEEDPYEQPHRSIVYWITAYVVREADRARLIRWATDRDLWTLQLHDSMSPTQVFFGEYPWAPAFTSQYPNALARSWTRLRGRLPVPVLHPAIMLHWESNGYDRSIEEVINLSAPSPAFLGTRVGLWPRVRHAAVFCNPSLHIRGPDALLGRASVLSPWLEQHGLALVWLFTGEKRLIGGHFAGPQRDLVGRLEISGVGHFLRDEWCERRVAYLNRAVGDRTRV